MKAFLKPIYEIITGEYILFENIIGNYIAMGIIGIMAFVIAWNIVGILYDKKIIRGKEIGSLIHWITRLIVFIGLFYISLGIIWLIKNIGIVLLSLSVILIVGIIWNSKKKKDSYIKYIEKDLSDIMNSLSAKLQIANKNQREELAGKGMLNCGAVLKIESDLISKNIEDVLEEISKKINETSEKFNNRLAKKENEYFVNKIVSSLNGIIHSEMKDQIEIWKNSLKQNVLGKTKNIFEKMTLLNSGKKIETMVWWGIMLSVISVIEGAISIYITLR